jgi:hypothetical protein
MKECTICTSLMEDRDRFCPFCGYLFRRKPPSPDMAAILIRMEKNATFTGNRGLLWYFGGTFAIRLFLVIDGGFLLTAAIMNRLKPTPVFIGAVILLVVAAVAVTILREILRHPRKKGNLLLKSRILSGRIAVEQAKVKNIDKLLENIYQAPIRSKVTDARTKIERLVDSLIECKVNLDFLRFTNDYSIIDRANRTGAFNPESLSKILALEDTRLREWKTQLQTEIDRPIASESYAKKIELAKTFKEQISLAMVSNILTSTSLLSADSSHQDVLSNVKDIDQEIERINYELDRLSAEVELDKVQ